MQDAVPGHRSQSMVHRRTDAERSKEMTRTADLAHYAIVALLTALVSVVSVLAIINSQVTASAYHGPFVRGSFDPATGQILCSDAYTCKHETGHWIDRSLGYPSVHPAFQAAVCAVDGSDAFSQWVQSFPGVCSNPILRVPGYADWGGYQEIYADIYAVWDVPAEFAIYYK